MPLNLAPKRVIQRANLFRASPAKSAPHSRRIPRHHRRSSTATHTANHPRRAPAQIADNRQPSTASRHLEFLFCRIRAARLRASRFCRRSCSISAQPRRRGCADRRRLSTSLHRRMQVGAVHTVFVVSCSQPHTSPSLYGGTLHGLLSVHPQNRQVPGAIPLTAWPLSRQPSA